MEYINDFSLILNFKTEIIIFKYKPIQNDKNTIVHEHFRQPSYIEKMFKNLMNNNATLCEITTEYFSYNVDSLLFEL